MLGRAGPGHGRWYRGRYRGKCRSRSRRTSRGPLSLRGLGASMLTGRRRLQLESRLRSCRGARGSVLNRRAVTFPILRGRVRILSLRGGRSHEGRLGCLRGVSISEAEAGCVGGGLGAYLGEVEFGTGLVTVVHGFGETAFGDKAVEDDGVDEDDDDFEDDFDDGADQAPVLFR